MFTADIICSQYIQTGWTKEGIIGGKERIASSTGLGHQISYLYMRNEKCDTFSLFISKAVFLSPRATTVRVTSNLSESVGAFLRLREQSSPQSKGISILITQTPVLALALTHGETLGLSRVISTTLKVSGKTHKSHKCNGSCTVPHHSKSLINIPLSLFSLDKGR